VVIHCEVSGQRIGPIGNVQEDIWTDMLSRNVGKELPLHAA